MDKKPKAAPLRRRFSHVSPDDDIREALRGAGVEPGEPQVRRFGDGVFAYDEVIWPYYRRDEEGELVYEGSIATYPLGRPTLRSVANNIIRESVQLLIEAGLAADPGSLDFSDAQASADQIANAGRYWRWHSLRDWVDAIRHARDDEPEDVSYARRVLKAWRSAYFGKPILNEKTQPLDRVSAAEEFGWLCSEWMMRSTYGKQADKGGRWKPPGNAAATKRATERNMKALAIWLKRECPEIRDEILITQAALVQFIQDHWPNFSRRRQFKEISAEKGPSFDAAQKWVRAMEADKDSNGSPRKPLIRRVRRAAKAGS